MSHSLTKLIDLALLPAALMVVGKFVGLIVTIQIFALPWALRDVPDSIFSLRPVLLPADAILASTYSDAFMYVIISIGFSFVLAKATHFHETHIRPSLLVKLSNHNLLGLVQSSFDVYHAAAVWSVFLWLTSIVVWFNALIGRTEAWVAVIVFISTIIFTTLLLQDVYKEIELSKKRLGNFDALS